MITSLKQKQEVKDGFRVMWFIPIEMVLSGTMLGLSPRIGLGGSLALIGIPAFVVLSYVARLQSRLSAPHIEAKMADFAAMTDLQRIEYYRNNPFDFTKPESYDEQVLKEMAAILNPYVRFNVREHVSKLYSSIPHLTVHRYREARYKLSQ